MTQYLKFVATKLCCTFKVNSKGRIKGVIETCWLMKHPVYEFKLCSSIINWSNWSRHIYWQMPAHHEVELDVHVLAETTRVVISQRLCVAKSLTFTL